MNGRQPAVAAPGGAQATARRYYVVAHDIAPVGYDMLEAAINVACQYGDDTDIVDTLAIPYHPMVRRIENGGPTYLEYGAWERASTARMAPPKEPSSRYFNPK